MSETKSTDNEVQHDFEQLAEFPSYLNELSSYRKDKLEKYTLDMVLDYIQKIKSVIESQPGFKYPYGYEHSKFDYWKDEIPNCSDSFKVFRMLNSSLCEQLLINVYRKETYDSPLSNEELFLSRINPKTPFRFSSIEKLVDSLVNTGRNQFNQQKRRWESEFSTFPSQLEQRVKEELERCMFDFKSLNHSFMPLDEVLTNPDELLNTMNHLADLIYDFSAENITDLCILITDRITLLHKIEYFNSKLKDCERNVETKELNTGVTSVPTAASELSARLQTDGLTVRENVLVHCYREEPPISYGQPGYADFLNYSRPSDRIRYPNDSIKKAKSFIKSIEKTLPYLGIAQRKQAESEINTIKANFPDQL